MSRDVIATYLEADVRCYHCGHSSGILRRPCAAPRAPTLFRDHAGSIRVIVKCLTDLRCARCRGPVYADAPEVRYGYAPVDPEHAHSRRGRPPRWRVEQRMAEPRPSRSSCTRS